MTSMSAPPYSPFHGSLSTPKSVRVRRNNVRLRPWPRSLGVLSRGRLSRRSRLLVLCYCTDANSGWGGNAATVNSGPRWRARDAHKFGHRVWKPGLGNQKASTPDGAFKRKRGRLPALVSWLTGETGPGKGFGLPRSRPASKTALLSSWGMCGALRSGGTRGSCSYPLVTND